MPLKLTINQQHAHTLQATLALTPAQRAKGFMHRTEIPEDEVIVFLFTPAQEISMWMKNTYVPLDMVFIDTKNQIIHIEENTTPESLATISSGAPAWAVIELVGGTSKSLNLSEGDHIIMDIGGKILTPPESK